jgi:hypothetical protein
MLDKIRINNPCEADWDLMKGSNQSRFCERCQKTVYNLSEMTEAEAMGTVCGPGDPPCVRYARMADGRVRTTDRAPRWMLTAGLVAAAAAGAALGQEAEASRNWLWQRIHPPSGCVEAAEPAWGLNPGGMIPEMGQSAVPPTEPVLVIEPMHDMQVLGGAVSIMPVSKPPPSMMGKPAVRK